MHHHQITFIIRWYHKVLFLLLRINNFLFLPLLFVNEILIYSNNYRIKIMNSQGIILLKEDGIHHSNQSLAAIFLNLEIIIKIFFP